MFKIRFAEKYDCSFIMSLIRELAKFEEAEEEVKINSETLIKDGFGKNPLFKALILEWNNQSIGYAIFYFRYSTWYGKALHLEDIYIKAEHRGKGYAKKVFAFLADFSLKNNVKRIEWEVLDWNQKAIQLYESLGARMINNWNLCKITNIDAFSNKLKEMGEL